MNSLFFRVPTFIQNSIISIYNTWLYRARYGGNYKKYLKLYQKNLSLSLPELKEIQIVKLKEIVQYASKNSTFYNDLYKKIEISKLKTIDTISILPILHKENLRQSIKDVYTLNKKEGIVSKTGGTTGKSLEVLFTKDDMQMRYAMLDSFRASYGYKLGVKTAWFSGKNLLSKRDITKNRFWKTDYINKVRYYSTFHIDTKYLKHYIEDLIRYKPKYMVGFPSSILEIAKYGIRHDIPFPKGIINTIFPTAETVTQEIREVLTNYFHAHIADQYASSEGAPLIFECNNNNLHLELQSGVFEVLDDNNKPTNKGRLVVTSFTTHGTPLIRYDIGDSIKLSDKTNCSCGNNNPIVDKIMGRIDDYIYSPETGKINLGNVSNTLKSVYGIQKFQVIQDTLDEINIKIVIDSSEYDEKSKQQFIKNWKDRVGDKMKITLSVVDTIASEKSGKFRMVKNNIKHLLNE